MTRLCCTLLVGWLAGAAMAERPNSEDFDRYGNDELLLLGEVIECQQGPTAMSMPPIYHVRLKVKVTEALRGRIDMTEPLEIGYSQRGGAEPRYDAGAKVVIAASTSHRAGQPMALHASAVIVADEAELAAVRKIAALPLGWTMKDGNPISPWAKIEGYHWPNTKLMQCSVTQHPAGMAEGIEFKVEPIIDPAKQIKWTNPDGDGEFRITVTNPTDKPISTGLWQVDGEIRWEQSLVIICQGKAYPLPDAKSPPQSIVAHTLKPGESVSTTIDVLKLEGPDYPRGGMRIEYLFALGNHGFTHSFYYMSRHHDKLRNAQ